MHVNSLLATLGVACGVAQATKSSTLLSGGTIIAFDKESESLEVIRGGSLLISNGRIVSVNKDPSPSNLPKNTERIDVTGQIITPGFVDTHRHGWQTAYKTIASNTTLAEYFGRYGEFASATSWDADDVYLGQLTGIWESLNGGVTTMLDHAHHTWSNDTAQAGLNASVESGARVFWAYTFHEIPTLNYTIKEQFPNFRQIAEKKIYKDSPTELGISFDSFGPQASPETPEIVKLMSEYNVSVLTTHCLMGAWGISNSPSDVHAAGALNTSVPVVFSHASFITPADVQLLRTTNQYISITPESEMHYGHGHPHSYVSQDQAALGVDTHFTFSADILTQARLWLQSARLYFYNQVLNYWEIPASNPMSVYQAFLLATRSGGLALRRDDIGIIAPGAKADIVVWDAANSPALLGWSDPVAAVMLHASPGDVLHVLVDGKFLKRNGRILASNYAQIRKRFVKSAKKIQDIYRKTPVPVTEGVWTTSGYDFAAPHKADVVRGNGTGYGKQFLGATGSQ